MLPNIDNLIPTFIKGAIREDCKIIPVKVNIVETLLKKKKKKSPLGIVVPHGNIVEKASEGLGP